MAGHVAERGGSAPEFQQGGGFPSRHVSLTNPEDDGATDLPRLLRRLADLIEAEVITATQMLDVVVHHAETTEEGPRWSVTVHWSPDSSGDEDVC